MLFLKRKRSKNNSANTYLTLTMLIVVAVGIVYVFFAQPHSTGRAVSTTCFDSDGGLNYYLKGNVTYGGAVYNDRCVGNSVIERYCYYNYPTFDSYICPTTCKDGACVSNATQCKSEGQNCVSSGNCCSGLVCSYNRCLSSNISIRGYVKTSSGVGISGVSIVAEPASLSGSCLVGPVYIASGITDANGYYQFNFVRQPSCDHILITPSRGLCSFNPANAALFVRLASSVSTNFVAACGMERPDVY